MVVPSVQDGGQDGFRPVFPQIWVRPEPPFKMVALKVAMTENTPAAAQAETGASPAEAEAAAVPPAAEAVPETGTPGKGPEQKPGEIGGPNGPEPTRYGDWEFKGRCSDF